MNYRKTALVCGCSFTAGSYSWDPAYIQYNEVLQSDGTTVNQDNGLGRERLDINGGWVEHLDPQDHYTIYAISGGGIAQHATVVEHYYQTNQLADFDYIVIQCTWEPRLTWNTPGTIEECFWYENDLQAENIDMYQGKGTSKNFNFLNAGNKANLGGNFNDYPAYQKKLFDGLTNTNVVQSCATLIDERCKQTDTQLFYFPWTDCGLEHNLKFENGIRLQFPYPWGVGTGTMDIFLKEQYHVFGPIDPAISRDGSDTFIGHFTSQGNRVIGERVRKELDQHL